MQAGGDESVHPDAGIVRRSTRSRRCGARPTTSHSRSASCRRSSASRISARSWCSIGQAQRHRDGVRRPGIRRAAERHGEPRQRRAPRLGRRTADARRGHRHRTRRRSPRSGGSRRGRGGRRRVRDADRGPRHRAHLPGVRHRRTSSSPDPGLIVVGFGVGLVALAVVLAGILGWTGGTPAGGSPPPFSPVSSPLADPTVAPAAVWDPSPWQPPPPSAPPPAPPPPAEPPGPSWPPHDIVAASRPPARRILPRPGRTTPVAATRVGDSSNESFARHRAAPRRRFVRRFVATRHIVGDSSEESSTGRPGAATARRGDSSEESLTRVTARVGLLAHPCLRSGRQGELLPDDRRTLGSSRAGH